MALDAAHRASIYEKLRPVLGDENALVFVSQFPLAGAKAPVTTEVVRDERARSKDGRLGEMAELRAELSDEISELRSQLDELKSSMLLWLGSGIAAATALQRDVMGSCAGAEQCQS
jgi:hypothetical protein